MSFDEKFIKKNSGKDKNRIKNYQAKFDKKRNKINLLKHSFMDFTSRLEGYLNHQIAYPNPIPILPVPKTLHDKKDTTLLQMAMKAFVKQRLFGRMHNYEKDNKQTKKPQVCESRFTAEKSQFLSSVKQIAIRTKEVAKRDKNVSMMSEGSHGYLNEETKAKIIKTRQLKDKQKAIHLEQKRLSAISSSFDFKAKVFPENKSLINSHAKLKAKPLGSLHQSFNLKNHIKNDQVEDYKEYPGTSFISAIEYYEKEKLPLIEKNSDEKFKLPEILDKRKSIASKLDLFKNQKVYTKKQSLPQVSVNDELWSYLSKDKSQKARKVREQKLIEMKESLLSIAKSSDAIEQMRNFSSLRNNEAGLLSKEAFQLFLNNAKLSVPFFVLSIMNFFECMNKIIDKSKKVDFESCLSTLYSHPDRAWCVCIFRFFDINTDGKIDSSDLFKVHNLLEQIIEKIETTKPESGFACLIMGNNQSKTKFQSRQATQMSQNESSSKNQKQKTQMKQKIKQKTDQNQKMSEESYLAMSNFIKKNLQNLKAFQKQVQKLNLRFIQKDGSSNSNRDFYNPQIQQYQKNQKSSKMNPSMRYLQEALLKNKDLKIPDLNLILEEVFYQNGKNKKKVIDIDYKKLNLKLSSSYIQTFTATNHNEQTRINRQHLQSLKDHIKSQEKNCGQMSNLSEAKALPAIKYSQFFQEKLFIPFKNMFFQCLHSEIVEVK